jgi:hypothetical protein
LDELLALRKQERLTKRRWICSVEQDVRETAKEGAGKLQTNALEAVVGITRI